MKLSELAEMLGSKVIAAEADFDIAGISTLDEAREGDVTFVTDRKFASRLGTTKARAVLLPEKLAPVDMPYIPLSDVWSGVLATLKIFYPDFARKAYVGIHPTAVVDPTAQLASDVNIGPNAVIGADVRIAAGVYIAPGAVIGAGCTLGENCIIYANAVLESGTVLGCGVIIQPGAVLGADGFKYEILGGRWTKIPQVGNVELADDVEVGANACLDRASFTKTAIGPNTKIDNLVQIAHNVRTGENCIVVAQTGISGSTSIGDNTIMAGQSGVVDNVRIGNNVVVLAKAGVTKDIPDGQTYVGMPARPYGQETRIMAVTTKLPEMASKLARLTKKVAELEALIKK